ncbi:MAG TPA: hypothetical protein VN696_04065 [Pyrinomonadaceae bacterium]|nr:hypothetical protein [Pyrinomonadaceae bacterium]
MNPHLRFQLLVLSILIISCAQVASAQCTLKSDQLPDAPELHGFRLGMTPEQAKARVPLMQFGRADEIGVIKTSINPLYDPRFDKVSFADVRTISLDFLDGKVTTLWIGYESTFKWQTVDEFVAGISKSLNLPAAWSPKRGGQQLHCDGFTISVSLIAQSPSIRLSDDAADETIATRREAAAAADEARVTGDKISKLYYAADCEAAEKIPAQNRIVFKDKDEAEKAGYKAAKDCQ